MPHLEIIAPEAGPERGDDAVRPCAKARHGGDCRLDHAGERATPTRVRRPNDARVRLDEEKRHAVCRENADGEAGPRGDDRVRLRRRSIKRRLYGYNVCGVDLMQRGERLNANRFAAAPAIFRDRLGLVVRARTAIEGLVNTARDAALAPEKPMARASSSKQRRDKTRGGRRAGHGANPAGIGKFGEETQIALKISPI